MAVSAEWVVNKQKNRVYTVSHAAVVVRNHSTVDQDLTAVENDVAQNKTDISNIKTNLSTLSEEIQNNIQSSIIDGNAVIILGKVDNTGEITVPNTGWEKQSDSDIYYLDIVNSAIDVNTVPFVSVSPDSYQVAEECGLKMYCRTLDGILRLYADGAPSAPIVCNIVLVNEKSKEESSPLLTVATPTSAGAVIPGTGFNVDDSGTISVDTNVVVTDDDLVDEDSLKSDMQNLLNGD